jgi:hypothetical protein
MEEATIKLLAQVVSEGVDIWKEEDDDEATSTQANNDSGGSRNSETTSAIAICRSLRIRNSLKLV